MSDHETPMVNGVVEHKIGEEVLPFVEDEYGGVIVEMTTPTDPKCFEGFRYHHAEPTYLMLVYWIPESESTIPLNASHRVRVGAVVLNHNKEEKYGLLRGSGVWKIPTGVVDEGEDIFAAAIREVKEETGIDTEFLEVLAFCQTHESFFVKSDLFFICLLRPTSFDIQKQDLEIEAAQWMPFEDSASQPITHKNELFKVIHRICSLKMEKNYTGFSKKPTTTFFDDKLGYLYLNKQDMNNPIT
ncbi:hypothetical protein HID58_001512 [Brassica napus]|uniref:Nudix hydrolase n=1 Tax=Brassica napus TaxID=3708 RepID=A0ABQ8EMN3_BRANA|nr:hypothetical protein HID58_001512 [Brassica napus]